MWKKLLEFLNRTRNQASILIAGITLDQILAAYRDWESTGHVIGWRRAALVAALIAVRVWMPKKEEQVLEAGRKREAQAKVLGTADTREGRVEPLPPAVVVQEIRKQELHEEERTHGEGK